MFYHLYNLFTAPGVVLHELAHAVFCLFAGVKIHRVKLFGFGRLAGYVVHDEPRKFFQGFLISIGPLIINSAVTAFLFALVRQPYLSWDNLLYGWLGFALGMHAIPSNIDASTLFHLANRRVWRNPFVLLGYPFILALYVLYFLKRWHIDIVYAALLFWLGAVYLKG